MAVHLALCIACFLILIWHSRLDKMSLGLPIAYLFGMLLQHLPGGFAHLVAKGFFEDTSSTAVGLELTTIGTLSFVAGVIVIQRILKTPQITSPFAAVRRSGISFPVFCLLGGWFFVYGVGFLTTIPSLGAAIDKAGAVWILGVLLGVCTAVNERRWRRAFIWMMCLSVYPVLTLLVGGFLSFGSVSVFMVASALVVMMKSNAKAYLSAALFSGFCFLAFLSYFQNRDDIRAAVWGRAELETRIENSLRIITDLEWFDPDNVGQLRAMDDRLNQNAFAGMAAQRLASGQVDYLGSRSISEGLLALIPRALWRDKPIFAGSSEIIREMTGFVVNDTTTYGVGQVMEFYVSFGLPSLIGGFLIFGLALGWLDRIAAVALGTGDFGRSLFWFLPAVAMNMPLVSIAEVLGGVAAAIVAGFGWRFVWRFLETRRAQRNAEWEAATRVVSVPSSAETTSHDATVGLPEESEAKKSPAQVER